MRLKTTALLLSAALGFGTFSTPALATTMFGSLSNFDVVNDTGEICRGFEIELEGVNPSDISFTFGNPYIRYGDPTLTPTGSGGTVVRYASTWDGTNWAVGTPVPSGAFPTGGHQCFYPAYGGDPNYETLGGEHFGIALNGNPTNTIYRWLLGDTSGNLVAAGSNVKIPAPIWNVQAPANPAAPAAVQAVIPAPPIEPGDVFGEAMWVKVFVMEAAEPAELEHLLPGDPRVPDGSEPAEIEIEWQLLQAGKDGVGEIDSGLDDLAEDSQSITRRYEFYKYIGPYNEEGEAKVEDADAHPEAVGEFLGSQNAALNLEPFLVPEPSTLALLGIGLTIVAGYRWRRRR